MSCSFTSSLTSSDLSIIITKEQLKYAGSIAPHKKRVWSPVLEKGIWFTNIFVSALFAAFSIFNAYNNLVRQMIQQKIKQFLKFFRNYGKKMYFYFSITLDRQIWTGPFTSYEKLDFIEMFTQFIYSFTHICYNPCNDTFVERSKPELLLLFEPRLKHWPWYLEVFIYRDWSVLHC